MPFKREWRKFESKAVAACKKVIAEVIPHHRSPSPERKRTPPPSGGPAVVPCVNSDITQSSGTAPEPTKPSENPSNSHVVTETSKTTAENKPCTPPPSSPEKPNRDVDPRNSASSEIKPDPEKELTEPKAQANDSGFGSSNECAEDRGLGKVLDESLECGWALRKPEISASTSERETCTNPTEPIESLKKENRTDVEDLVEAEKLDLIILPGPKEEEQKRQTEIYQEQCTNREKIEGNATKSNEEKSEDVLMRFNILNIPVHSDGVEPTDSLKNIPGGTSLLELIGSVRLAIANYKLNDGNQRRVYAEHTKRFCDYACQIMVKLQKGNGEVSIDTEDLIALKQNVRQTIIFHEKHIASIQQHSDDVFQVLEKMQQSLRKELRIPFGTEEATTRTRLVQMKREAADCLSKTLFQLEAFARYTTEINNWLLEYERFLEERITKIQCARKPSEKDEKTELKEWDLVKKLTPQILNTYSNLNQHCLNAMDLLQNELSSYGKTFS